MHNIGRYQLHPKKKSDIMKDSVEFPNASRWKNRTVVYTLKYRDFYHKLPGI